MAYGVNAKKRQVTDSTAKQDNSNKIRLSPQKGTVIPDLRNQHSRMEWANDPTWGIDLVRFQTPINVDDRSLHYLTIDNSRSTESLEVDFSVDWVLMESRRGEGGILLLPAGAICELYGCAIQGQIYLKGTYTFKKEWVVDLGVLTTEAGEGIQDEDNQNYIGY